MDRVSDDALTLVLESMDGQTFEDVALKHHNDVPPALKPRAIAAMRGFVETTTDHHARLRIALDLIELGETGLHGVVKDAMEELPGEDRHKLDLYFLRPALEFLHEADPSSGQASGWQSGLPRASFTDTRNGCPSRPPFPTTSWRTTCNRLETENLERSYFHGMIEVISVRADSTLSARLFAKLRELRRKVDADPGDRHEIEWKLIRQLEAVFRGLPDDIAADGVLSSVTRGDSLEIKVAADLLSRVARSDVEPLRLVDPDLRARIRAYLKGSVDLVLRQDDFNGEEKANLASSIAQGRGTRRHGGPGGADPRRHRENAPRPGCASGRRPWSSSQRRQRY